MSKKSKPKSLDEFRDTFDGGGLDQNRSPLEPPNEANEKNAASDEVTKNHRSNGTETSEHLSPTYSTEKLIDMSDIQNVSTDSETYDEEENLHYARKKYKEQGFSQLHIAAKRGDTEDVRSLLMSSANISELDREHNTPLHISTQNGRTGVVDLLLRNNASVNSRNARGRTPVHLASRHGHFAIAQLLLKNSADVHVTDQSKTTPIDIATRRGHCELVQLLSSAIEYSLNETSSLHSAAKCGNALDVHQILLNTDTNPDATNLHGDTPLHLASENGHLEIVERLLRNKADINIRNASFKTSLHIAAKMGYVEIVNALLDHEGEVNSVDLNGNSALHLAASNGHSGVVNILHKQTTVMDAQIRLQMTVNQFSADEFDLSQHSSKSEADVHHTSHQTKAEGGTAHVADTQMSHSFKAKTVSKEQLSPVRLAANQGHAEICNNLIFKGASVNACNNAKMTALHLACRNGHTSIAEILLNNKAIVDVMTQSEKTPFYLAAENGHAGVTDLLLHRGVCDFVLTDENQTPLDVAVKNGHTEVVEVIFKHRRGICEKLAMCGKKLHENIKTGVMSVQILKSDDRRISAEIVWTERHISLELRRDFQALSPLTRTALANDPKMVELLLSVDERLFSERDITLNVYSIVSANLHKHMELESFSDAKKFRVNFRKPVQFLINSSKFNVNHQEKSVDSFLHEVMEHIYKRSADGCLDQELDLLHLQNQIQLIQLLLEKGADVNKKNSVGQTPLMIASVFGCCEAIQTLFDWERKSGLKVDIDARDNCGDTALFTAVHWRNVPVMRVLLKHKASVNIYSNRGYTVLHAVLYDRHRKWFDRHILGKRLCRRNFKKGEGPQIDHNDSFYSEVESVDTNKAIYQLWEILEHDEKSTGIREEMVKLLIDNVETDVNARDLRGNTPLDLAMMSSKPISSATFEALKNRGAFRNVMHLKEEAPNEESMVDERGRNPLHLLIISRVQHDGGTYETYAKRFDPMIDGVLQRQDTFRRLATATDDKGRTPLHYVTRPGSDFCVDPQIRNLVKALLELGSNLNATDMYGKTLLHYVENDKSHEQFIELGASEHIKDKKGHTAKQLQQLRGSVNINERNAKDLPIGKKELYISTESDVAKVFKQDYVTELSKETLAATIRICSQSPRPIKSVEEAIWDIWTQNDFIRLNARLSRLHPLINRFIERLADAIKEKDGRFECQPTLVGSAMEETKVVISGDFDFNFKLIKFGQFCEPFRHPLGPKGYFELRRKSNMDTESRNDGKFDCFFNSDQCLLTSEINYRFQIILEEILGDHNFWRGEHLFECDFFDRGFYSRPTIARAGLCKTFLLRMIHPIEDGEDDFLLVNISIDIVACVHVVDWWPEDTLPIGINPAVKTDGCAFVFDRPRFDPSKPRGAGFLFSDTFARISFAPVESRIIKESSLLMKAAYIFCKLLLYYLKGTTYQLKTSFLFCMEALTTQSGSEGRNKDEITQRQLAFWVERIMFCFVEFSRHHVYPCYFMPSFKQREVKKFGENKHYISRKGNGKKVMDVSIGYSKVFDIYLDICPDDAAIEFPAASSLGSYNFISEESFNAFHFPSWEHYDREKFIRRLSSRCLD